MPKTEKPPKLVRVDMFGDIDTRRLFPDRYASSVWEFREYGIELPGADILDLENNLDYRLLLSDLRIVLHTAKDGAFIYDYFRGYITDFASVPWIARSAVDNDDRRVLRGAFVHDQNHERVPFGRHEQGFTWTNDFFEQMLAHDGFPWWRTKLARFGVDSREGWESYQGTSRLEQWKVNRTQWDWVADFKGREYAPSRR